MIKKFFNPFTAKILRPVPSGKISVQGEQEAMLPLKMWKLSLFFLLLKGVAIVIYFSA
jgi:hypothetical protein